MRCPQVCSTKDDQTDKIALYCEPMPEAVGPLAEAMAAGLKIHKLILMDTTENIDRVRPDVERLIGGEATFTQVLGGPCLAAQIARRYRSCYL